MTPELLLKFEDPNSNGLGEINDFMVSTNQSVPSYLYGYLSLIGIMEKW